MVQKAILAKGVVVIIPVYLGEANVYNTKVDATVTFIYSLRNSVFNTIYMRSTGIDDGQTVNLAKFALPLSCAICFASASPISSKISTPHRAGKLNLL